MNVEKWILYWLVHLEVLLDLCASALSLGEHPSHAWPSKIFLSPLQFAWAPRWVLKEGHKEGSQRLPQTLTASTWEEIHSPHYLCRDSSPAFPLLSLSSKSGTDCRYTVDAPFVQVPFLGTPWERSKLSLPNGMLLIVPLEQNLTLNSVGFVSHLQYWLWFWLNLRAEWHQLELFSASKSSPNLCIYQNWM